MQKKGANISLKGYDDISPPINPELKPSRSVCRKFRFLSYTL